VARFFIIYIESLPAITRWAGAWSARRFMNGNLTAVGKWLLNFALIQCLLGLICTILLFIAFYQVIETIGMTVPVVTR